MKKSTLLFFAGAWCSCIAVSTCTPEQRAEGIALAGKEVVCVLQSIVETGLDDPRAIVSKCGKVTIGDVAQLTQQWLDETTSTEAGPPASVSPLKIRFALVHDRALTQLDGGP